RCRREDDRDGRCLLLCRENHWDCICDNNIDFESDELGREHGGAIAASLRPAILDDEVATFDPAEYAQPLQKSSDPMAMGRKRTRAQEPDGRWLRRLLRPRRRRPRGRREAWLRIFVVRCSLPCDPPVGGHSCNGGMVPRFHRAVSAYFTLDG